MSNNVIFATMKSFISRGVRDPCHCGAKVTKVTFGGVKALVEDEEMYGFW